MELIWTWTVKGYDPVWQEGTGTTSVTAQVWLEETASRRFRVWSVNWMGEGEEYVSLVLDDETGLPLSIRCEGDRIAWTIAEQWKNLDLESWAYGLMESYLQVIQPTVSVDQYWDNGRDESDGDESFCIYFELYFASGGGAVEETETADTVAAPSVGTTESAPLTVRLLSSGGWSIHAG